MKRSIALILSTLLLTSCSATPDVTVHTRASSAAVEAYEAESVAESLSPDTSVGDHISSFDSLEESVSEGATEIVTASVDESSLEQPQTEHYAEATDTDDEAFTDGISEVSTEYVPQYTDNYHGHVYTGGQYSKKYHYEANCAGKSSHEITWDEVKLRALGPCGTCVLK